MLKFTEVLNTIDKKHLLQSFNPYEGLWVTSDIKSRFSVIKQLQTNNSSISSNCVKRVADFWCELLSFSHPQINILPRDFLVLIYQNWADSRKQNWEKSKETGYLLCQYIEALSHLLQHPLKNNLVEEWSKTNKTLQWTQWYNLASDFWNYLKQINVVELSWVAASLLDRVPYENIKFTEIIFDLGFDINTIEAELIYQMSKKVKINVLIPRGVDSKTCKYTSSIYRLFNQKEKLPLAKEKTYLQNTVKIKKFATPLAEVKDIISQIASAIDKKIPASRISVLAPNIEDYWVCLKSYLIREKIPVNKNQIISLYSFPFIQLWLAKIETHLSIIKYENMEAICSNKYSYIDFSQLKAYFCNTKEIEDWPACLYTSSQLRNKTELTTAHSFIKWIRELLPDIKNNTIIDQSVKDFFERFSNLTDFKKEVRLAWQDWFNLLKFFLKRQEVKIKEENPKGINCLSFNALGWVESDFIYVAGLSEQNLKSEKHNIISVLEAESITKDLGFFIKSEPIDKPERIISHFIHQKHKECILSFSSTDFLGTPLNPSHFWLEKAIELKKNIHHFDTSGVTMWDKQQRKPSIEGILSCTNKPKFQLKLMEQSIIEDQGYIKPFYQKKVKNLSPSALDSYIKCPFIFAARKIFHLWDGADRYVDIPIIERGVMIHKLFEVLQKLPEKEVSEKDILQIIEKIKTSEEINLKNFSLDFEDKVYSDGEKQQKDYSNKISMRKHKVHPVIWQKEKFWLLRKTMIFLKEKQRRETLFNDYQVKYCEKQYHCYWNFKTKSLSQEGDISFKGKIDYIDSNSQSYQIVDYKHSLPIGSSAPSWESQQNFQLAFYIQALEKGLTDLPPLPVRSALYLSYKNFSYQGLANKEVSYVELLGGSRKRSLVSAEQKKTILQNVNKKINSLFLDIYNGHFQAQPKTKTLCTKCRWRKICRASHLN